MNDELFVKLRYCFAAGYTLPQYCIDNGIKRPLFVLEKKSEWFLREVLAQFRYDKRISYHQFCFIDAPQEITSISLYQRILGMPINVRLLSKVNLFNYDAIIFLTQAKYDLGAHTDKIITFATLENFFIQRTYIDIPILHFLQRFPEVKFFLTNFPSDVRRYEGGAEFSKQLPDAGKLYQILFNNKDGHLETPFDKLGYTNSEVMELLKVDKSKQNLDGTTSLLTDDNPLKQIKNGKRTTAYQPKHYVNKIHFFGACYYFGRNAPYDKTIESYLQQMLNDNNLPYRVENEGQAFSERSQDMFYNLNALNPAPGDIIFFYIWNMRSNNNAIPFVDVSDAFDPPNDYRKIFCTKSHVNELGYKLLAEKYFKFLTENNFFRDVYFNYPTPPPILSQIWYTTTIRGGRHNLFRQRGAYGLQTVA